ncbi:hypothetical protein HY772_07030 [Candidatus Woesearchaeota archaeon]|nr:hypothetical protein [Candidatus Woesearchaeota archaeon]
MSDFKVLGGIVKHVKPDSYFVPEKKDTNGNVISQKKIHTCDFVIAQQQAWYEDAEKFHFDEGDRLVVAGKYNGDILHVTAYKNIDRNNLIRPPFEVVEKSLRENQGCLLLFPLFLIVLGGLIFNSFGFSLVSGFFLIMLIALWKIGSRSIRQRISTEFERLEAVRLVSETVTSIKPKEHHLSQQVTYNINSPLGALQTGDNSRADVHQHSHFQQLNDKKLRKNDE